MIVLTGRADDASIRRCEELGVLYVHKGADAWTELQEKIQAVFEQKRPVEAAPAQPEGTVDRSPRILLVDDDPVVLKTLVAGLQKYDLDIIQASSGMQGFWQVLKEQPELVITDHNMEQGSGHYLLSRIKGTPSTRHIPVVVFTSETLTEGLRASFQRDLKGRAQAAGFLTKPINAQVLAEVIGRYVPLRDKAGLAPRTRFG